MTTDPIALFRRWFARAEKSGLELPNAMALATANRNGQPSVRYVLMKEVSRRGVVFYTNVVSRKVGDLRENPRASVVFYWHQIGKQIRFDGRIEPVSEAEADAYWRTRPRQSQLAALASRQSAPLRNREALLKRHRALVRKYRGRAVPRPPGWTGFRLVPQAIEFWTRREHRLHERELFTPRRGGWKRTLLQP
jgi:pyridoxamine 5'-phosphate oxidase